MEEFLFRGFHECENGKQKAFVNGKMYAGEWKIGILVKYPKGDCYILCEETNDVPNEYSVIPETVGQYTGLTDTYDDMRKEE